jgi:hypothetical protein
MKIERGTAKFRSSDWAGGLISIRRPPVGPRRSADAARPSTPFPATTRIESGLASLAPTRDNRVTNSGGGLEEEQARCTWFRHVALGSSTRHWDKQGLGGRN